MGRVPRQSVLWVLPLIVLAYVVYAGALEDSPSRLIDAQWLYVSGASWLAGDSPYNLAAFNRHWISLLGTQANGPASFTYPPTIAILTIPAGFLSWKLAQMYFVVVNMIALGALWWLSVAILGARGQNKTSNLMLSVAISASGLISAVPACIYIGQTGIIATLGAFGTLWAAREGRPWAMVIFVLLASIKPQLTGLVCLYALVLYGPKQFLPSLAVVVVGAVVFIFSQNSFLSDYQMSIQHHLAMSFNQDARYDHLGAAFGHSFFLALALCGAMLVLAIAIADRSRAMMTASRQCINTMPSLMCIVAITLACMPIHKYDWVFLVPTIIMLAYIRPVMMAIAFAAILAFLMRIDNWITLAGGYSALQFVAIVIFLFMAIGHWIYRLRAREQLSAFA